MRSIQLMLACVFVITTGFGQPSKFDLLSGNSEEVVASFMDHKNDELITLDKAGLVVIWNTTTMLPLRRFSTIPANPFLPDKLNAFSKSPAIKANEKLIWITYHSFSPNNQETTDIYLRQSGKFSGMVDTSTIQRLNYLKNNDFVSARSVSSPFYEQGQVAYGYLSRQNNGDTLVKNGLLKSIVSCIEVSPDEKLIAVGYQYGGVDVFDAKTLKLLHSSKPDGSINAHVNSIKFLPNNKGVVYSYPILLTKHIYLHHFNSGKLQAIELPEDGAETALELSPSGKFLSVLISKRNAWLLNLETNKFENEKAIFNVDHINNLHFLNDDLLLALGNEQMTKNSWYSYSTSEASIKKVEWKTNIWSHNYALDAKTAVLQTGAVKVYSDTTYSIRDNNKWAHFVNLPNLDNKFYTSFSDYIGQLEPATKNLGFKTEIIPFGHASYKGLIQNENDDLYNYAISPLTTKSSLILRQNLATGRFDTGYKVNMPAKLVPAKINTASNVILFMDDEMKRELKFSIQKFDGKHLLSDSVEFAFKNTVAFSADGNWATYQKNSKEVVLLNLANQKKQIIKTGSEPYYFHYANPQFVDSSTVLVYEQFNLLEPNSFTLIKSNLKSGKNDTLTHVKAKPLTYAFDNYAKRVVMQFAIDFTDTMVWQNAQKIQNAALYSFRNIYNPILFLVDVASKEGTVIRTKGKISTSLALMGDKILSIQKDGSINYYNIKDTADVARHWLKENDQVLMNNTTYYASPSMVSSIIFKDDALINNVGKLDVEFNQPHKMMQYLRSNNRTLKALFERAYNKRLEQFNNAEVSESRKIPAIGFAKTSTGKMSIIGNEVTSTIQLLPGKSAIKKLVVKVNDFPVFGKEGLSVTTTQNETNISIPLDSGLNKVSVVAIDANGNESVAITNTWYAKYSPAKTKRTLWVVSAGVSNYIDSVNNLTYAAKDASDFSKLFSYKEFDTVIVKTLTNDQVIASAVETSISTISAKKHDVVLVYLAGHGLLDSDANFYFATHDVDFKNPQKNGLSYSALVNGIDALSSKNKVLFLDACHSGLVDRSRVLPTVVKSSSNSSLTMQGARSNIKNNGGINFKEQDVFLFMQKNFAALSQDNTVNILAAALGNSYALESPELQNGVFTYALIKGLGLARAKDNTYSSSTPDYAEGSAISIKDLENYLTNEVLLLSKGAQVPSFNTNKNVVGNIVFGEGYFPGYLFSITEKDKAYKEFLDKYKSR